MDKQYVTYIMLPTQQATVTYSEQETAAACHLAPGVIRHLRAMGLVQGERIDGQLRYYEEEIQQLRQIRRLQRDLGINLAGVEVILHLLARLEALRQELEQERQGARERGQL